MSFSTRVLRSDEQAVYKFRELYKKHGYSSYKVSRFEEYDLYARNKSFLVSENILTFTDTNGKLMALKPDVTLSIIKNISADDVSTHKLYYNENVYRTSAESHGFKEIMQTGLECIGNIDTFAESEVIMLAMKSLGHISDDYIMDISHMGVVEGLLDAADIQGADRSEMLRFVESKNITAIKKLCEALEVKSNIKESISVLTEVYLPLVEALEILEKIQINEKMRKAYEQLKSISDIMAVYDLSKKIYFDFSVVNDCNYYDGVIFKGFINGIPDSVLSGGRYDRLLTRMGKQAQAIGFAVYLDRLERFGVEESEYDVDVLIIYDKDTDIKLMIDAVNSFNQSGKTVRTAPCADRSIRYRRLLKIGKGGIETLEAND